jgi:hypothetical protein
MAALRQRKYGPTMAALWEYSGTNGRLMAFQCEYGPTVAAFRGSSIVRLRRHWADAMRVRTDCGVR